MPECLGSDLFNWNNFFKLSTKEGAQQFHVHRILGFVCLFHYLYRIGVRFATAWDDPFGPAYGGKSSYETL